MPLDFTKLNFFNRLDARARVAVLFGGIIGVGTVIYLVVGALSGGESALGPSRVANVPQGVQAVPGSANLRPEYQRVLMQSNKQLAENASMTGGSAIPTLVNLSNQPASGGNNAGNCNIICSDQSVNVKSTLDDWVSNGKITAETSAQLQTLANKNVTVAEYAAQLDQFVKDGKLSPEQARELLAQYKKQHENAALQESAKVMDEFIKTGRLPLATANDLLAAQKQRVSPAAYAQKLQQMVQEGNLTPEVAQQLLTQFTQQHTKSVIDESIAILHQMASHGEIIPEVEKDLVDLEMRMVPIDDFAAALKKHIDAGKLIPLVADKILLEYKSQKASIGPTAALNDMVRRAEQAAYDELSQLLQAGKITDAVANQLRALIDKNVTLNDFTAAVNQLVQQNKLSPGIAKLKIADYKLIVAARGMAKTLATLQANNASASDYEAALKTAVKQGLMSPEQAAEMMRQYSATLAPVNSTQQNANNTEAFNRLLQNANAAQGGANNVASADQFATAATTQATEEVTEDLQAQQARINATMNAMAGQAAQLINAWQPDVQSYREGQAASTNKADKADKASSEAKESENAATKAQVQLPVLIKAGSVMFAVLDTAVNSDYPDSPVMATIVDGPLKGSKLLGKLTTTKGVSGQLDRVSLNFTLMNNDDWMKSKTVTAYAIDPDTARTVLASHVDYHYMQRFGAIMATSFVQGYANAIGSSSSTTTTGIFGTSTTHPELSPSQKLATAIGQIGQSLGTVTQNYVNIPPTVKVDSGVGLGILFMSDVT